MSKYEEDYEDDYEDENLDDDDGEIRRSTSNPFSASGASVRGAGIPARPNTPGGSTPGSGTPSQGGGINTPSPIRSGGTGSSSGSGGSGTPGGNFQRPNTPPSGGSSGGTPPAGGSGSGGSGVQPYKPSGGSFYGSGSGSNPASSGGGLNRPGTPGASGGSTPARPSSPFTRDDDDDKPAPKKDDAVNRVGNMLGSFGAKTDDKRDDKKDDRKDDKPASSGAFGNLGNLGNRFGGGDKKDDKPDPKKDDKPSGGGIGGALGGLGNRFGGGDKKDDKPDPKKDDKPSGGGVGGALGGLGNRFGGGDKKDAKPDPKKDDKPAGGGVGGALGGALGGLGSKLPFGGGGGGDKKDAKPDPKKDDKPAGGGIGGALGGLGNRFGGGDKPAEPAKSAPFTSGGAPKPGGTSTTPAASNQPGGGGGILGGKLPFGGGGGTSGTGTSAPGAKPGAPNAPGGKGAPAKSGAKGANAAPASFMDRVRGLNPFKSENEAKKARASKAPKVDSTGLTLDNKLDILGVSMVLGALILLLSSLSPVKGALTSEVNRVLSEGFGWGAIGVVLVIFAIGVILILRHFGDDAPVIPRLRVIGAGMLFVGMLIAMQFVHSVRYEVGAGQDYLWTVKNVFLTIAWQLGQGGGRIGGEIYFFLISNFTEIGGLLMLVLWVIVALMLTLNMSASDLAIIVISLFRSLGDSMRRRQQRGAAVRAAKAAELAAAAPQISVSKPDAGQEALPAGAAAALPAPIPAPMQPAQVSLPAPEPERSIPITMGGRTYNAPMRAGESVPLEPAKPLTTRPSATEAIAASLGGVAAVITSAGTQEADKPPVQTSPLTPLTTAKPAAPTPPSTQAATAKPEPDKGGIGGRLGGIGARLPFGGRSDAPKKEDTPALHDKPASVISSPSAAPTAGQTTAGDAKPEADKGGISGRLGGIGARLPFGGRSDAPKKDERQAVNDKPAATSPTSTQAATAKPGVHTPPPTPDTTTAQPGAPRVSRRDQLIAQYSQQQSAETPAASAAPSVPAAPAASAAPTPPPTPTQEAAVAPKPSAPVTPAPVQPPAAQTDDEAPVRLGDLLKPRPFERKPLMQSAPPPETATAQTPPPTPPRIQGGEQESFAKRAEPPKGDEGTTAVQKPISAFVLDDEDETGNWATLPPAKPKTAEPAKIETPKADIPDLQTRLNALRARGEGDTAPATPAAVTPRPPAQHDDDPPFKPDNKADNKVDKPAAPEKAHLYVKPQDDAPFKADKPADKPSPALGKPDDNPFLVTSRPTAPPPSARGILGGVDEVGELEGRVVRSKPPKNWKMPGYNDLIISGQDQEIDHTLLLERARTIQETLESFGAPGRVVEVRTGPVITQFGVEPDYVPVRGGKKMRVKVSSIAALDKDIQLALGARSIRIEAPVPGKGYVGIEVPNDKSAIVRLRDVLESKEFKKINSPLAIALGQGVDGTPAAADLASMPHLLIAGTTGSGKSVCVNAIIASLLLKNSPSVVKFIMVDPKRVELTGYNGIPHLVAPVVTELERIVSVLKWVTREMDERYRRFSTAGARNIEDYNKHLPQGTDPLPYIVVIIDELADLMMLAPDETERVITRIAALARATGIHLVIATQRPSVDVVTGLIKANFPARIAFAVASGTDSRVILDQPGADRLLGRGDMLYMSGDSPAPVRMQGVFVSDAELGNITNFWRSQMTQEEMIAASKPLISAIIDEEGKSPIPLKSDGKRAQQNNFLSRQEPEDDFGGDDDDDGDVDDALYNQAVDLVRRQNRASVSLLQRKLRIGYTRAARLIDLMEERGIVGPAVEGSKPREVLLPPPK